MVVRSNLARRARYLAAFAAAGALAFASGCGEDEQASGAATGGAPAGDTQAAQAFVDAAMAPVEFEAPGGPVDIAKAQGKTIWLVTWDASVPFVQQVLRGADEAAKTAGTSLKVFDAKSQTGNAGRGVEQAIAAGAPVIVLHAINFDLVKNAVEEAHKAGIPVIGLLNTDVGDPIEAGAAGEVGFNYEQSGKLVAAYAIANTDDPVHAVYQDLPGIQTFEGMRRGVESGFDEFCPDACSLKVDPLSTGDYKTQTQTRTASLLARDPKVNWVIAATDGLGQFAIPSIEAAGKKDTVRLGSINAVSANLEFVRDERVQAVDVGNHNAWLGWAVIDRALRALAGEEPAVSEVPVKLFDKGNLEGIDLKSEDALFDEVDYRSAYQELWQR